MMNEYEDNTQDESLEEYEEETELETVQREICETKDQLTEIDENIRKLWDGVMKDYLKNSAQKQILLKLDPERDYIKFYQFYQDHDKTLKKTHSYLYGLYEREKVLLSH